jgi:hypothetical protein
VLLLLVMYLSPVIGLSLYWYAQRTSSGETAWETLAAATAGRAGLLRPVLGAFAFAAAVVAIATGARGGVAFLFGALTAAVAVALASSTGLAAMQDEDEAQVGVLPTWADASTLATSIGAVAVGAIGAIAWFFADPAGAVVLAAFAAGASSAALFVAIVVGTSDEPDRGEGLLALAASMRRRALSVSATASLHSHLAALAAVLMIAATGEPESLLALGGLLAETETLRSELLLLPIAVSVLAPIVALLAAPVLSALGPRRGEASLYDLERAAAVLSAVLMVALVSMSGLSWAIAGAFTVGLGARQLANVADEARSRRYSAGSPVAPSLAPAFVSAVALLLGDHLAGWYGMTLVALGMTATFVSAAACAATRELSALTGRGQAPTELSIGEATATVAATLALLVASAPVIAVFSAQRGEVLTLVATAAPALLLGAVAGASAAQAFSRRYAEAGDESEAVRHAAEAVVIAVGFPALAGVCFGGGAAVGVALGFAAWAAASAPVVSGEEASGTPRTRMPDSVLLAWGRTMALAALVGAPLMR